MVAKKGPIRPESILSDVIKGYPHLRRKIGELFGKKCLSCPASTKETIAYTAFNRGHDPGEVVSELNRLHGEKKS